MTLLCRVEPVTQGSIVRAVEARHVRVTETQYPAHLHLAAHVHEHASLTCILRGGFEETSRGGTFACGPHTVLFKPAGEAHSNRYGPAGAHCLLVEVPSERLARSASPQGRVLRVARPRADAVIALLAEELAAGDALAPLAIEGLALELLAEVGRAAAPEPDAPRPPWFDAALEELAARYRDPFSVRELAAAVAVHPVQLARAFRRHAGTTPAGYVRGLRVEWAKAQLLRTDRPIAHIAQDAGFADQSHLTRVFRRAVGNAPGRFRAAGGKSFPFQNGAGRVQDAIHRA